MAFNVFGHHFRIMTFGESHGPALGVIIDGMPPRITLDLDAIQSQLDRRRPGRSELASPREEPDRLQLLSGLLEGQTTGAPICLMVSNEDARPEAYEKIKDLFRPGHADLTTLLKYGIRDWRGGGRASGRETVARVAAGAVARQLLSREGVNVVGHVVEIAGIAGQRFDPEAVSRSPICCGDPRAETEMIAAIEKAKKQGDSVGGVVEVRATGVPAGWGDPVFGKLDARLAGALMSIGAVKGVEIGDGFQLARLRGSQANDAILPGGEFASNRAGGILGGISSGAEIWARIAVKPTPSIRASQQTVDTADNATTLSVSGRHDPCIAPRLVPVAEAMTALVLADACLAQRVLG